ncbi:hypothetical protein Tco_0777226 [Tanacetum coccineum]
MNYSTIVFRIYPTNSNGLRRLFQLQKIILTWIDNDIYCTVDACPNACEMWKAIERLKHGELINVQDLETNLYWEFGKFTSRDGESLESYYSRMAKICDAFNEIRAERLARTANPLALVAQQQPAYHPHNHLTHYTNNSLTKSQQAATRNRGKAIVNSPPPTYDQEHKIVSKDDALSKEMEIDKLMALISLSFNKIYKPTNNNLKTSSNTSTSNQDNTLRINICIGYDNPRVVNVVGVRENVEQADWRDDTDDEPDDQELEAHYTEHLEQPGFVNDTYLEEQGDTNITIDSLDMSTNGETVDQDDDDLSKERDLLASLIEKLKCEIADSKNRNKFLESSNQTLIDKLKVDVQRPRMFPSWELDRYHDVELCVKTVEIDYAKSKGDWVPSK